MMLRLSLLVLAAFIAMTSTASAAVWYVNVNNGGTENGTSWAAAFNTIQEGVNAAAPGDEVWVAAGTYTGVGGNAGGADNVVVLDVNVQVYGGFSGTESSKTQRNWVTNVTIIDAQNVSGRRCVYGADNARLDGFTVKRGKSSGGGIYLSGVPMSVANCVLDSNTTTGDGGALYVTGSGATPSIENTTFVSNTAASHGGAMYITNSAVPTITDSKFIKNSTPNRGGAAFCYNGGSLTVSDTAFIECSANSGGALEIYGATTVASIERCVFGGNLTTANHGGAILTDAGTTAIITECYFVGNATTNGGLHGGALAVGETSSPIVIRNCAFTGNKSGGWGGALTVFATPATVRASTFANNSAADHGGAIYNGSGSFDGKNLIIRNNFSPNLGDDLRDANGSGSVSITYSNMGDVSGYGGPSTGNISVDPQFETGVSGSLSLPHPVFSLSAGTSILTDSTKSWVPNEWANQYVRVDNDEYFHIVGNTATTLTVFGDASSNAGGTVVAGNAYQIYSVRLKVGSPSVDSGTAVDAPITDIEGNPRPIPNPGNHDMGAFENQPPFPSITHSGILSIGNVITLSDAGSDRESDSITSRTWAMTSKPEFSSAVLSCTSCASPTFQPDLVGSYEFSLVASDGHASSATATYALSFNDSVIVNTAVDENNGTTTSFAALRANPGGFGISLREAMLASNNVSGAKSIFFSESMTIGPTSALPTLDGSELTIDGSGLNVIIRGLNAPGGTSGITSTGSDITLRGLTISDWPLDGVRIDEWTSVRNSVYGCYITQNGRHGIHITDSSFSAIGSAAVEDRNIISGNGGSGIYITGTSVGSTTIRGNYIGISTNGSAALPNGANGILIVSGAAGTTIGGAAAGERNVISGNFGSNIYITGEASDNNIVRGNYIGLNAAGTAAIPNGSPSASGVVIAEGADNNVINNNVISGNRSSGVFLSAGSFATTGNTITSNKIGTDPNGTTAIPNQLHGVYVQDAASNFIGLAGQGNVISGNSSYGVLIENAIGTASLANIVRGNIVGLDPTGTQVVGNGNYRGISIVDAVGNIIGGTLAGERNIIGGNREGITITGWGGSTAGNKVEGNYIGTDVTETLDLGNADWGIMLGNGSRGNVVGGSSAAHGNVIAFNNGPGILASPTVSQPDVNDQYRRNRIYSNVGKGIRLDDNANSGVLPPVITSIDSVGNTVTGTAYAFAEIDVFFDLADEGQILAGSGTADSGGNFIVGILDPDNYPAYNITATQTRNIGGGVPLHTSEFSAPLYRPVITPAVPNLVTDGVTPETYDLTPHEYDQDDTTSGAQLLWSISPISVTNKYTASVDANDFLTITPAVSPEVGQVVATLVLTDSHGLKRSQNIIISVGLDQPTPPLVLLLPDNPIEKKDNLFAVALGGEVQAGATKYFIFKWYKNDVLVRTTSPSTNNFDTITSDQTAAGEVWKVEAYTDDGTDTSIASDPDQVTIVGRTNSVLTINASSPSIILGQSVTLSGSLKNAITQAGINGENIFFDDTFTPPGGTATIPSTQVSNFSGAHSQIFTPDEAGAWSFSAKWLGNQTYNPDDGSVALSVAKAQPGLALSLSASSAPVGYTNLTATATLSATIPISLNGLLYNQTIRLFLREPDGTSRGPIVKATDGNGVATFAPTDFTNAGIAFDDPGTWQFLAEFLGDVNFLSATSPGYDQPDATRLTIKDGAGYAIIAVGKLDTTGEGAAEHSKTGDKVYRTLLDRGFAHEDIYYLRQGNANLPAGITVDDLTPTQGDLQTAITSWALTNMNAAPGPLYLVLLDHGLEEQFYIYGGSNDETRIVTPIELDGYLNTLEAALNSNAEDEQIIVVYGACHSGSFIADVSGPQRVIVTSASHDEKSHRGPADPDGIRDGEVFVTELFRNLGLGKPLKESFELASGKIREYTENRSNGAEAASTQTPLLDDNADADGSTSQQLAFESGLDGAVSHEVTLGFGLNAAGAIGWINASPTVTLGPSDPVGILFARAQTPIPNGTEAWLEVKTPAYTGSTIPPGGASSTQLLVDMPDFDYEPGISNLTNGTVGGLLPGTFRWQTFGTTFDDPGTYKVFYYVKDGSTGDTSAHLLTTIYRQSASNQPPTTPSPQYPADNATTLTSIFFAWSTSTDPDLDAITYRLQIAEDTGFTTNLITKEGITTTFTTLSGADGIIDGRTYYWRVFAVDVYGLASTASATRTLHVDNTNSVIPGVVAGKVLDVATDAGIPDATVTVEPNYTATSNASGVYYVVGVPTGTRKVTAVKTGYNVTQEPEVSVGAGETVNTDIHMSSTNSFRWGDVSADANAGTYDASLILQWIAYPLPGGINKFKIDESIIKPLFPPGANVNANADTLLNPLDVTYLLQYKVKLIEKLPADTNGDGLGPDAKSRSKAVRGETTRTISVPAVTNVEPGQTVDVAIELDDAEGVAGMEVRLDYDVTVLDVLEVVPGSLFQGWGNPIMGAAGGQVIVVAGEASGLPAGPGTIAIVRFQGKAEAAGLLSSLTFSTAYLNDTQAQVLVQTHGGIIHVVGESPNDIDANGVVDAIDVQLVVNAALALDIGGLNADVNGDSFIDAIDIQAIINAALGIKEVVFK